jgi:hypothetical protein
MPQRQPDDCKLTFVLEGSDIEAVIRAAAGVDSSCAHTSGFDIAMVQRLANPICPVLPLALIEEGPRKLSDGRPPIGA